MVLKSYALSSICELYQHQIYREVRLHSALQHENVVLLYAAFQVGGSRIACCAMTSTCEADLCEEGVRSLLDCHPVGHHGMLDSM